MYVLITIRSEFSWHHHRPSAMNITLCLIIIVLVRIISQFLLTLNHVFNEYARPLRFGGEIQDNEIPFPGFHPRAALASHPRENEKGHLEAITLDYGHNSSERLCRQYHLMERTFALKCIFVIGITYSRVFACEHSNPSSSCCFLN
jgi:hypothetical protein